MHGIILALLAIVPIELIVKDRADVIEVNHFHDSEGRLVFDQLVMWERTPCGEGERCFAWRLLKNPSMIPEYRWDRGQWSATFLDGEAIRRIDASRFRESWTQFDPEFTDRDRYPKDFRRELRK